MKRPNFTWLLLTFGLIICLPIQIHSQELTVKKKTYKIWIETMDDLSIKGYLHQADSLGITVSGTPVDNPEDVHFVPGENIRKLKLRRKSKVGKSIGIGFAVGAVAGAVGGYASGDSTCPPNEICLFGPPTAEDKAIGGGIFFGVIGTGIGAITGSLKREMAINGNINMYYLKLGLIRELWIRN